MSNTQHTQVTRAQRNATARFHEKAARAFYTYGKKESAKAARLAAAKTRGEL